MVFLWVMYLIIHLMGCEVGLFQINYKVMNSLLTGAFLFAGVYCVNSIMKCLWLILTFIILIQSDTFVVFDEQRVNWFNSLVEGTYVDGNNSTIIKKNESGNIIIKSIAGTSFCSMEYDSTGRV